MWFKVSDTVSDLLENPAGELLDTDTVRRQILGGQHGGERGRARGLQLVDLVDQGAGVPVAAPRS